MIQAQKVCAEGMLVLTGAVLGTETSRYDAIKQQLTFIGCTPRCANFMWLFTLNVYLHASPFGATPTYGPRPFTDEIQTGWRLAPAMTLHEVMEPRFSPRPSECRAQLAGAPGGDGGAGHRSGEWGWGSARGAKGQR